MPVWPKSFYTFGLSLSSAATEWSLRQKRGAAAAQTRALRGLTAALATTAYGKQVGIESRMGYAEFQKRVPLQRHEQLVPLLQRMQAGEADVLWPGRCTVFVKSSGTTTGAPKLLPLTDGMLSHFRRAWLETLLYYTVRVKHAQVFGGRHLFCGGSTAFEPVPSGNSPQARTTELSGACELSLAGWPDKYFYEPGAEVAQLSDWPAKVKATARRTAQADITLLAGIPTWTLNLANGIRESRANGGLPPANLQGVWSKLECYVHRGVPIGPFYDELRATLGPKVKFHEVFLAPEGLVAAQDGEPSAGLRVLADAGLFLEFLPMAEFDEARLDQIGAKAVPLSAVRPATNYVLLLTTPAGLVRHVVGDVVRFTSTEPPRMVYVGRTRLRLNAFGESVIERELTDALVAVCQRRGWTIVNFHVAPLFANSMTSQQRGRHEWWIELKPGTVATPTGPQMAIELDAELMRQNPDYTQKRKTGGIDAPFVRLVMPGVFEHWLQYHGRWGGEHKMPRCRSDRSVADELAQITNFARD
ncbi:MAG TPA: GH3 auxin-responsive promoter family protein [Opitutaceae bacterium]|nr:GH3 auxin-responsive promoter family protein [Opitutaceae bacterium]